MGGRLTAATAGLFAALTFASSGAAGHSATITVKGTATFKPFDITKNCTAALAAGGKSTIVKCTDLGTYAGTPAPAGAGLGWAWSLRVENGSTTGLGTERGNLILNFGSSGMLYLSLKGSQVPVGKPSSTDARAKTTGTWAMTKGTQSLAGKHGSGKYTFTTGRTGSKTLFSLASMTLDGTIS